MNVSWKLAQNHHVENPYNWDSIKSTLTRRINLKMEANALIFVFGLVMVKNSVYGHLTLFFADGILSQDTAEQPSRGETVNSFT
jgi:hypothetical protein